MGTAPYMSPEQVRGEKLDARTDLYSFGLVIYEMATETRAFSADTTAELHEAILNRRPVPARDLNAELPPGWKRSLTKRWKKTAKSATRQRDRCAQTWTNCGDGVVAAGENHRFCLQLE